MSDKDESTLSKKPTLASIEKHLKQQDKEMKKSILLTFAAFGAAVAFLGLSLAVVEDYFYFWVVALGVVVMVMSRRKVIEIDKKE